MTGNQILLARAPITPGHLWNSGHHDYDRAPHKESRPPYLLIVLFPICLLIPASSNLKTTSFALFNVVAVVSPSYWATATSQPTAEEFHRGGLTRQPNTSILLFLQTALIVGYSWPPKALFAESQFSENRGITIRQQGGLLGETAVAKPGEPDSPQTDRPPATTKSALHTKSTGLGLPRAVAPANDTCESG